MSWHRATILSRRQLSPSVTGLTLVIDGPAAASTTASSHGPPAEPTPASSDDDRADDAPSFSFLPGMWVDFKPRPCSTWDPPTYNGRRIEIGGYSLTSVPSSLPEFELAIQVSRHPVARWAAERARADDAVDVRVGGTFTYKNEDDVEVKDRCLFVAGGVGINPLFSMIRQWNLDHREDCRSRAMLLYSCRSRGELLFVDELGELARKRPDRFRVVCTTTKQRDGETTQDDGCRGDIAFREGRIDSDLINGAVRWLNETATGDRVLREDGMVADAVFVCGPPGMPESISETLLEEKLVRSADNVHFEQWW